MSQEDKEQQARIALLDNCGSLARNWATVVLATVVAFYSVWQIWQVVHNDFFMEFLLTMTMAEGAYAFIRMVTLGKYCEFALDSKVRPRGDGVRVNQMSHGMLHRMRADPHLGWLDKLGHLVGFVCWTLGCACAFVIIASSASLVRFPIWVPVVAVVALVVLFLAFHKLSPEKYENETVIPFRADPVSP